ncbi:MAG: MFS transporter [Gammaproteobacteria bacterium]|nr:MFS transporter [Gammaproteobacteria bacterium]MDH5735334.1 MFS transporter [Gammaproteobacteria bacterium]
MSTIVVARKNGKACIAADTLTTFGDLRMSSEYDAAHDKIQSYGDGYFGIVGSAAHALVMESVIKHKKVKIDFSDRMAIFETFRQLHPILKEKYFLNVKDDEEDPYEATHIDALICNPDGIFGVYSLREVSEYKKFWAIGSGSEFALGAMHAMYDHLENAEDIARAGVAAGVEFNNASSAPFTFYTVDLKD